jgi:hypothetical protein
MRGEQPAFQPEDALNNETSRILTRSKEELIEFLRHQANLEWGGYRLYDGTQTHIHQNPEELTEFIFHLISIEKEEGINFTHSLNIGYLDGATDGILNKIFCFDEMVAADNFSERGNGDVLRANLRYKNLTLICGDSTSERVKYRMKILGPYDLIFIDANHDYEFVKQDFENALGMINPNGVIALHDICAPSEVGVQKLWDEICSSETYSTKTIFNPDVPMKTGIGVVRII